MYEAYGKVLSGDKHQPTEESVSGYANAMAMKKQGLQKQHA